MRKLVPAFVLTSIVALASGSALALGDMNKNKPKAQTAPPSSSTYNGPANPSGSVSGPASSATAGTTGTGTTEQTPTGDTGSLGTQAKQNQIAKNDDRCDAARYPNRADLPKECLTKSGTGAAAANSHQKQSGQ